MPTTLKMANGTLRPDSLSSPNDLTPLAAAALSSGVTTINNVGTLTSAVGYGLSITGAGVVTNSGIISGVGGIDLGGGGSVANFKNGSIAATGTAGAGILISGAAGTVTNSGSISAVGTFGDAVALADGGSVANFSGGVITGSYDGILVRGAAATITNSGRISGTNGVYSSGISVGGGGSVTNDAGGVISGVGYGVIVYGTSGTVTNNGQIISTGMTSVINSGVYVGPNSSVSNTAGASISGRSGVIAAAYSTVTNDGTITSTATTGFSGGVFLFGNGDNVVNGGLIQGNVAGVYTLFGASATVTNSGTISGTGNYAVGVLLSSGTVTNQAGKLISGNYLGVWIRGGIGRVSNSGTIIANGAPGALASYKVGYGVYLQAGGTISNAAGANIFGTFNAIGASGPATITNSGRISSSGSSGPIKGVGADLRGGGSLLNSAGASISGSGIGVDLSSGTIINAGTISGGNTGIDITFGYRHGSNGVGSIYAGASGFVTNTSSGTISGGSTGIYIPTGTVSNDGTISGDASGVAVKFGDNAANRLIVGQDAVFIGTVNGGGGTLEFGGSSRIGGVGTGALNNFSVVDVDAGVSWQPAGTDAVATLLNDGIVGISGAFDVSTAIDPTSTGLFKIGSGVTLEVAADTGILAQIQFVPHGTLAIDNAALFGQNVGAASYAGPQLQDFVTGDSIDLKNFAALGASFTYTAATGVLQVTDTAKQTASLSFQTSTLGTGNFHLTSDGGSGLLITHS